jgi:hypothetical protein
VEEYVAKATDVLGELAEVIRFFIENEEKLPKLLILN